jgi:uncharacterized protein YdaU (DUF1376 family)
VNKSPAFQFYVNDFLGSAKVGMMNGAEIGVYFMLLLLDWQEDGFKYDPPLLARWCRVTEDTLTQAWVIVGKCFGITEGRYRNPRLQGERTKQEAWRAKCSEGGIASGKVRLKGSSTILQQPMNTPFPSPTPTPKTTTTTTTTSAAARRPSRETWLTPYFDLWVQHYGGEPSAPELAKYLGRLRALHGDPAVKAAWGRYLSETEGSYANPARFSKTYGTWTETARPSGKPTQREKNMALLDANFAKLGTSDGHD